MTLDGLFDTARLSRELGISRKAAEAIMRQVPKVHIDGLRKVYVDGTEVSQYLESKKVAA